MANKNNDVITNALKKIKESATEKIDADYLIDELISWHNNEAEKQIPVNAKQLREAAARFKNEILNIAEYNSISNSAISKLNLNNVTKDYEMRTYRIRLAYLAAFRFDYYVKMYRKQPIAKGLYVFSNSSNNLQSFEISMKDLVLATGSARNIHEEWLETNYLKSEEDKLIEKYGNKTHIKNLQIAYETLREKMEQSMKNTGRKTRIGISFDNYKKKAVVLNYGDLKEAYGTALLAEHGTNLDKLMPAENATNAEDKAYYFYKNYVTKIDSKEALLGEDILLKEIQYAVKASGSRLPSLNQYIRLAFNICDTEKGRNLQKVLKEEEKKYKGKLRNTFVKETDKAFDKIIK